MTARTMITGLSGVSPKRQQDVVHIDFSADQRPLHIALHRGVLGTLIASLMQAASSCSSTRGFICSSRFHRKSLRPCLIP
jgi:hypothetical protein